MPLDLLIAAIPLASYGAVLWLSWGGERPFDEPSPRA